MSVYCKVGFVFAIVFIFSCKSTKFVPKDNYLLTRNAIEGNTRKVSKKHLKNYIKQEPNKKVLGLRFHLSLYNLSSKKREKGINKWLRKIGEEPAVLDNYLTEKSTLQLKTFLNNKGYYQSVVKDSVVYKNKKAKVIYKIEAGNLYIINSIKYDIEDSVIENIVYKDTVNSLLARGNYFDADILQEERVRLEARMRNEGYYNFSKEYIYYEADTTGKNYKIDIVLGIKQVEIEGEGGTVISNHKKYVIDKVFIYSDFNPKKALSGGDKKSDYDTVVYNNLHILCQGEIPVKPKVIAQTNYIIPGEMYQLENVDKTYKHLTSLKIYKYVNIKFVEKARGTDNPGEEGMLDCVISLTLSTKQAFTIENEVTNSAGNIGTAVNLIYQHKNLFKGAEVFDLKLKGAIEAIKEAKRDKYKNTLELGTEARLSIPKFLFPLLESEKFVKKYDPKTHISLAYNYQRRPDYTRKIANITFGYNWSSSRYMKHIIQPLELNAVDISNITDTAFINKIVSPYLRNSFDDHLVSVTSYSLIYNNQNIKKKSDFVYYRLDVETAGNTMSGINELAKEPTIDGRYKIFGIEYSQYIKFDFDFSYHHVIDRNNNLIYRFLAGVGYPYGNSKALPFEKKFFAGGANSIRAWQVRSLGPGSYNGEISFLFPNQTADIKLEANIEYRFKLFWLIEGALFVDAGNIWDIYRYDQQDGGIFNKNFYKDIAIGTGFGTRFDFNFFLFRLDFGIKARDPSITVDPLNENSPKNKWILGKEKLKFGDNVCINIGIGYPF